MIETIFNLAKENFWPVVAGSVIAVLSLANACCDDEEYRKEWSFLGKFFFHAHIWVLVGFFFLGIGYGVTYVVKAAPSAYKYAASWVEPKAKQEDYLKEIRALK